MKIFVEDQLWTDKPHNFFGLSFNFTRYILTSEKLITRKGFLSIKEDEVLLYRVIDKRLEMPFGQRIFGCGSIILHSRDTDSPEKNLRKIKIPRKVMALLDQVISDNRAKYQMHGTDMYGALSHGSGVVDVDRDGIPDVLQR